MSSLKRIDANAINKNDIIAVSSTPDAHQLLKVKEADVDWSFLNVYSGTLTTVNILGEENVFKDCNDYYFYIYKRSDEVAYESLTKVTAGSLQPGDEFTYYHVPAETYKVLNNYKKGDTFKEGSGKVVEFEEATVTYMSQDGTNYAVCADCSVNFIEKPWFMNEEEQSSLARALRAKVKSDEKLKE